MTSDNEKPTPAERAQAGRELPAYLLMFVIIILSIGGGGLAGKWVLIHLVRFDIERPIVNWIELVAVVTTLIVYLCICLSVGMFVWLLFTSLFLSRTDTDHILSQFRIGRVSHLERWLLDKLFRQKM